MRKEVEGAVPGGNQEGLGFRVKGFSMEIKKAFRVWGLGSRVSAWK
jgi:hypothetical protein